MNVLICILFFICIIYILIRHKLAEDRNKSKINKNMINNINNYKLIYKNKGTSYKEKNNK